MAFDLIFFGGTGDLTWRKLMPAVFESFRHGTFPSDGRILSCSRERHNKESYISWLWDKFQELSWETPLSKDEFNTFSTQVDFLRLDATKEEDYVPLKSWIEIRNNVDIIFYLAVAPSLFAQICSFLGKNSLNHQKTRVVLEKPLGYNLASAKEISSVVGQYFTENQIFRIDHYLGKQSVQNLMALRFGNSLFEPLWRREWIKNIQITIAEDLGVESRGNYYDQNAGALRDMVQNHMLQLLCIVAMEPPVSDKADDIRNEKLKVLKSLKPYTIETLSKNIIRGQYQSGQINNSEVSSYLNESGVDPNSTTETFVALKTEIENWRWSGVPFFLRTGKRMAKRTANIVINFRSVPHPIFQGPNDFNNKLVIELQPQDSIELELLAKSSNRNKIEQGNLTPVSLNLDFKETFAGKPIEAYERLIRKVIAGRLDLFVRSDEQEAAWEFVEPIIDYWKSDTTNIKPYRSGSWGPAASTALLAKDNTYWLEDA